MNCFQIIIFVLTRTAIFIVLYFMFCCELLSNHYLCADKNSHTVQQVEHRGVVNCFQIIIFVLTRTANHLFIRDILCCELLSNHYLCADKNSVLLRIALLTAVVNCFQIIIFVLTRTAFVVNISTICRL